MQLPETVCARARESVSAQLDGELSTREVGQLENHLLICPECSAWAEQVRSVTAQLRGTALEAPADGLGLSRRRPGWRVGSAVAVASAAALIATMFFGAGQNRAFFGAGQRGSLGSQRAVRSSVRFAGLEVSNGHVLEDGVFVAVSLNSRYPSFRPI